MKDILFMMLVLLLMPIYFIIWILKNIIHLANELGSPFAEGIYNIVENMNDFWKRFFKIKKKRRR